MFLIDILLMYLLKRPNQRFCGGQTFIGKVGAWSKFRIKLSDRHSLKGQRIEKGREPKPNSKRKIWFSVQDLAKPIICYQVDSIWPARDWFCKHQPICVWGRGMTRLGEVGKKWAWQSWKAASWPDPSVCSGRPRFRLRSQMSHLALSLRTGLGRIMRKISAEVIKRHLGI